MDVDELFGELRALVHRAARDETRREQMRTLLEREGSEPTRRRLRRDAGSDVGSPISDGNSSRRMAGSRVTDSGR